MQESSPTSSSILASAMSCSLPLPLAIFWASLICDLTASSLKSSNGNPSTALMLSCEFGCTIANPPDTNCMDQLSLRHVVRWSGTSIGPPTEKLFAASTLLNDFHQARFQLFDRGDVLSKNAHLPRLRGKVHLDTAGHPESVGSISRDE